jgi:hypothetical protein
MMKVVQRYARRVLPLLTLCAVGAAPPVNDQFANRTRLEGSRPEISGTFQGATAEAGEPATCCGNASVWWSWTSPESGLVLIQSGIIGSIYVTTAASLTSAAAPEHFVTSAPLGRNRYATFQAVAGQEYQVGAFGWNGGEGPFQLSLCITNAPIILSSPMEQTISPGESALLTVRIVPGAQIQWQFEGADLPNENKPTLARTNASPEIAGEYRAVISQLDAVGNLTVRTSTAARLTVTPPETPRLVLSEDPADSGVVLLSVAGQTGRWYELRMFDSFPGLQRWGGYFFSSEFPRRTLSNRNAEFFRLKLIEQSDPTCWINLQRIYYEKERLAAEQRIPPGARVDALLIDQQLGYVPKCPSGGTYTYGNAGVHCTCSIVSHILYIYYPYD